MSMAMSDTDSSFAQWARLYDHEHSMEPPTGCADGVAADANIAAAAATSPTSAGSGGSPTKASQKPGVEGGRVVKPARRRSRASRRAPVTLLNTDTANFRAMVQQFTGIPAPPAGSFAGPAGVPVINFSADYGFPPPSAVMSFDHLHRSHQPPATIQDQLRRQQQYTGATFGYNSLHGGSTGDVFAAHGLASVEDRMLLQSMQVAQMPHMPPASAANNNATGFFA
ncbi:VQ motif-containing protein 22-like [Phragmites australis]|uniref:VQ motif-containing protein 22-like n=1 Tax=Phragmites australis TaxID=29695 RepID=UPI002D780067|nr:VQ motif-containing protein 22-like [Phragmites australis]